MHIRFAVVMCGLLWMAGCGSPRPQQGAICTSPPQATPTAAVVASQQAPLGPLLATQPRLAPAPAGASTLEIDPTNDAFIQDPLDSVQHATGFYPVLAVSAGGQWGAYGAGVLAGLDAARQIPDFRLVTGISTGAMLAPLMFLGDFAGAKQLYTNITSDDIYRTRPLSALITANSIADNSPLRRKVEAVLTPAVIAQIRSENVSHHRVLAVQSVDIDAGVSVVFDLTAIAAEKYHPCGENVSPRDCIIHAVMAAAAIPVAFPPEFIQGDMYVDGGLRQYAFSIKIALEAVHRPSGLQRLLSIPRGPRRLRMGGPSERQTLPIALTLIANTDFVVVPQCVDNGILPIAERSAGIALDQLSIGSFYRLMTETLEQRGDTARFTYADPAITNCQQPASASGALDSFDQHYMRCLFKAGCIAASSDADIWHTSPDDLPQSPAVGVVSRPRAAALAAPQVPSICQVPA
jgi:hypothetical protein